jgi:hypothetical protein
MKEDLFKVFESIKFLGFKNSRYVFQGWSSSSESKLVKLMSPKVDLYPSLMKLQLAILKKEPLINIKEFEDLLTEWSELNFSKEGHKFFVDSEEDEDVEKSMKHLMSLKPIINLSSKNRQKVFLYDPEKRKVDIGADPDMYFLFMNTDLKKLVATGGIRSVYVKFEPYNIKTFYSKEGLNYLNLYIAPKWRFVDCEPKYSGMIKKLIDHLFPIEEEREYVLDWFHHSLTSRCETVLCLIGARGTGKGILLSSIAEALHSAEYFQIAKQEVLTDKFNGEFKNKRNIFFDEVDISGDREVAKFKAMANAKIAMEKKGEDSETIENFVSMSLASNYRDKFRVEPQDRRFSTPRITEVPLSKVMKEKEISDFLEDIQKEDSLEIAQFGKFLLSRVPNYSRHEPLKNAYFFDLCRLSMPSWKSFIIDYLIENAKDDSPITLKDLKKKFVGEYSDESLFPTKKTSIDTFFQDYLHEGKYKLANTVQTRDKNHRPVPGIKPNKEFLELFGAVYGKGEEGSEEVFDGQLDDSLDSL